MGGSDPHRNFSLHVETPLPERHISLYPSLLRLIVVFYILIIIIYSGLETVFGEICDEKVF
ncbi:hypothetical protein AB685_07795 [Bacillus sp. LL01]|nr:hypothetical protein AB685_07795 [Bacillus sp. LL01]